MTMGWGKVDRDRLPEGVTRVEYIEAAGNVYDSSTMMYIDTGIVPTIETSCEVKCMSVSYSGWAGILGSSTGDGSADTFYLRKSGNVSVDGYCCWIDGKLYNQILVDEGEMALCRLSKSSFEVNTTSIALNATAYGTAPTLPMFLFAINLNGNPWIYRYFRGRIYYCKIWDNGVLVRDYVPVRFENDQGIVEGAMWDKVSKQLFRNAGTGAFLYGPDTIVSKPVIGLHKKYDRENPYVSDGLVAMWDGKWNAGWGTHVDSSYKWSDLIGGFVMMTNKKVVADFTGGYLHKGKTVAMYNGEGDPDTGQGIRYYAPAIALRNHLNSGLFTIEIVFSHDTSGLNSWALGEYCDFGIGLRSSHTCIQFKVNGDAAFVNGVLDSGGILSGRAIPNNTFISRAVVLDKDTLKAILYENGEAISSGNLNPNKSWGVSNAFMYTNSCIGNVAYGASSNNWDESVDDESMADICAIRIYSRALTAAEIAANYAVDKQRFNLP